MKPLSSRTLLAMALAMAWPAVTAYAATDRFAMPSLADRNLDTDVPLHLTMSLVMTAPGTPIPEPAPETHQNERLLAYAPRDPRALMARLRMATELVLRSQDPLAATRLARASSKTGPNPTGPSAAFKTALAAIAREDVAPWGRGPADRIVDDEFHRALMRYVRMQVPTFPVWQAPRPTSPVEVVAPPPPQPSVAPQAEEVQTPKRTAAPVRKARRIQGLTGRAWRLSDQGYKAYGRGDYETALRRADEALKLRPDVVRLHQLRVYALQKLNRLDEASRAAEQAIAEGYTSPELQAAVTNLQQAPADAAGVPTTAEYRKAFPIATLAYEQLAAGKFADAASNAEIAVRTDPSQGPWSLLWLNSLEDLQRYEDMVSAGKEAIALGAPNAEAISALMRLAEQAIAVGHAEKAYEAMTKNRLQDAVPEAREAVRRAPDVASHHLLLISALQASQDIAGAEKAASEALLADDENATFRIQRAYLRQQLGQGDAAQQDIDAVLAEDWIDDALRRNVEL